MTEFIVEFIFSSIAFVGLFFVSVKSVNKYLKFNGNVDAKIIEIQECNNNDSFYYRLKVNYIYNQIKYEKYIDCFLFKKPNVGSFIKARICYSKPELITYFGKKDLDFLVVTVIEVLFMLVLLFISINSFIKFYFYLA